MVDDITRAPDGPVPARHLTIINATGLDQNFGLLVQPGSVDVAPDTGAPQLLAWKVALVPGRVASVVSRRHLAWIERRGLMLGRFDRADRRRFSAEALLPAAGEPADFKIGFIGIPDNGAAKLLRVDSDAKAAAVISTDGSFPPASRDFGSTRDLAAALAIDPEDGLGGAAFAVPLAPNMTMAVAWRPSYRVAILPLAMSHGDAITADLLASAYDLDFGGRDAVTLQFTDNNSFEEAG